MKNKTRKMLYSCFDLILGICQIGSIVMAVYKFITMIVCATDDFAQGAEVLFAPIAAWAFIAGCIALVRFKIEDGLFDFVDDDEYLDDEDLADLDDEV